MIRPPVAARQQAPSRFQPAKNQSHFAPLPVGACLQRPPKRHGGSRQRSRPLRDSHGRGRPRSKLPRGRYARPRTSSGLCVPASLRSARHRPRVIGSLRSPLTRPAPLPPRQPFVVRSSGKSISGGIRSRAYRGPLQTKLIRAQGTGKRGGNIVSTVNVMGLRYRPSRRHRACGTPCAALRSCPQHRGCVPQVCLASDLRCREHPRTHACRASVAPGGKAASLWLSRLLLSGEWGTGFTRFGPWRRGPKQVTQRTADAFLFLAAGAAKN
jgi:hypothetical protein